jgi:hypothetical protein
MTLDLGSIQSHYNPPWLYHDSHYYSSDRPNSYPGLPHIPVHGVGSSRYKLVGLLMASASRGQISTPPYQVPDLHSSGGSGFLPPNSRSRDSSRPRLGPHPVQHRQISQLPEVEMRQRLIVRFQELGNVAQDGGLVEMKQSLHERHHAALFVSQTRGELSHVHAGKDGSTMAFYDQD